MNISEETQENNTKDIKLYSAKAIGGATFLGGPLAAGYMIGENFKALERRSEGRNSLIIGILSTIILFAGIFMIPENIIDKIPRLAIPFAYTVIILGIVEWKLGGILKSHKENGNHFFSGWRAAGIGFLSLVILFIGIFGYAFLGMNNDGHDQYDKEIAVFTNNETESLKFYNLLGKQTNDALIKELENKTIPKWEENLSIIKRTNEIEDLPAELIEQNKILLKYTELRLEAFQLFKKAIEENTDKYAMQLQQIHNEIEKQLKKL